MFSCKYCEIFKNSFFIERLWWLLQIISHRRTFRSETIFGTWKPFKVDEKCFLFHLEILFVLKILTFCYGFLFMWKNGLIRKIRLIWKFITSKSGKKTIAIHILPNISSKKGNQTMKLGQVMECSMSNIFLIKHTQNIVENLFPDPFLKLQNWANFGIDIREKSFRKKLPGKNSNTKNSPRKHSSRKNLLILNLVPLSFRDFLSCFFLELEEVGRRGKD